MRLLLQIQITLTPQVVIVGVAGNSAVLYLSLVHKALKLDPNTNPTGSDSGSGRELCSPVPVPGTQGSETIL